MTQQSQPGRLLNEALPTPIGSYVVDRLLAGGPSYADYEAQHRSLGHRVLFRHERWPTQQATGDALDALRRSRRLQAEIRHPHILPVIDFFERDDEWFSVFASAPDARSLAEIIETITHGERPPCGIAEFVALSEGVTDGLAAIHRVGFVHRTLGIHNVLVDTRGHILLSDLGCATPIGVDDAAARAFRSFMQPASAAPEQFTISDAFSTAIDNWALGVTLFQLRYGYHPFWKEAPETWNGIVAAVLTGEIGFPAADAAQGDRLLQPWLRRLLERVPERRYADALEAQRDLRAIAVEIEGKPPKAHAFVAMPFFDTFDDLWRAIWSACIACRVAPTRVDQSLRHENIWDEICAAIAHSDFTIAVAAPEASGVPNPNVMIEIGYARALKKPVLLLTSAADTLPFDLRTQRALIYEPEAVGGGAFHRELVSFLGGILDRCVGNEVSATQARPTAIDR
jgi:Protein kinase domain